MGNRVKSVRKMRLDTVGRMLLLSCMSVMITPTLCTAEMIAKEVLPQHHTYPADENQDILPLRIDLIMAERDWVFPEQDGAVKILPLKILIHNTGGKPIRLQNAGAKRFFSFSIIDPKGRLITEPMDLDARNDGGRAFSQYETCPTIKAHGYLEAEWEIILERIHGFTFVSMGPKNVRLPVWGARPIQTGNHIIRLYYSGRYLDFKGCWDRENRDSEPIDPSPEPGVASSSSIQVKIQVK